jgi:predicted RNA-binding protein YlqC (UPF0109 family)
VEGDDHLVSGLDTDPSLPDDAADAADDDAEAATGDAGRAGAVLAYLAAQLTDEPDSVRLECEPTRSGVKLSLRVAPEDMGRVIGRRGRIAQSIRTVVRAAAATERRSVIVDIVE